MRARHRRLPVGRPREDRHSAFGRFWWDFLIGDDWKIAAAVGVTLGVAAIAVSRIGHPGAWFAPVVAAALLVAFVVTFAADVRQQGRRGG